MQRNVLIRGARQLATLHGPTGPRRGEALRNLGIIEDGSVLVVDGVVASVGPTRRIENLAEARNAEEINASGHVVIPGFVDSHTRLISAPARVLQFRPGAPGWNTGAANSASSSAAIQYLRTTSASSLEFQARRHLDAALRHGTTMLEAKSGSGLSISGEMKSLRVLAGLAEGCVRIVPTFAGTTTDPAEHPEPLDYVQWVCSELMPRLRERKFVRFVGVDCDAGGFGPEASRMWLDCAARLGFPAKVHADAAERTGGAQLAVEFRALTAEGLNSIERPEVDALSRSQTIATLLPGTVHAGLQGRFPPARALIDSGAAVAIASGFDPSCASTLNMQSVISLACSHMKMTVEEAISAATINGAHAVGQGARCGSLEFGKDADLLILNVSDYREIPLHFGCAIVAVAMRQGRVLYREGALSCCGA